MSDLSLPSVRLAPAEMQSQRIPGRKRGRPPLHSTPVKMAVHNLYSASAGSLPAVKIPKKRGRKPGYKVWLHGLLSPQRYWAGAWVLGQKNSNCRMWGNVGSWDLQVSVTGACAGHGLIVTTGHMMHAVAVVCIFASGDSELHQVWRAVRRPDFRVRATHTLLSLASKLMFQTLSFPCLCLSGWLSKPLSRTHSSLILVEADDVPETFKLIMRAGSVKGHRRVFPDRASTRGLILKTLGVNS